MPAQELFKRDEIADMNNRYILKTFDELHFELNYIWYLVILSL